MRKPCALFAFAVLLAFSATLGCSASHATGGSQAPIDSSATVQEPASAPAESLEPHADARFPGSLCVIEYMGNGVTFLTADTGEELETFQIGLNPAALVSTSDGSSVFVANSGSGEIARIALDGSSAVQKARVGTQPMALALDEAAEKLYVADYHLNSIRVVDTALMSLVDTIPLAASGYESREIAPACCFDPLDGTVMQGRKPVSLALSPDKKILYCANIGTYDISRIDLETGKELEPFDGVIGFRDIVISRSGEELLCAGAGSELIESSELIVVDTSTGSEKARIPVGAAVSGAAWSTEGDVVVAISKNEGSLVKIDPGTWTVTGSAVLAPGLADVAISPDGAFAYAGNSQNGSVFCIDLDAMDVVYEIESLADPRFLGLVG